MVVPNIYDISDPDEVYRRFLKYKGRDDAYIAFSTRKGKKYMVVHNGRATHFGSTMPDFTRHRDESRRQNYLRRAKGIKGDWRNNKYSANQLAINLLW
jgi:hypothetical protein